MKYSITQPLASGFRATPTSDDGKEFPILILLVLEDDEELSDFLARMGIVAGNSEEVERALIEAVPFDDLPMPNDIIFDEFYESLCEFVEKHIPCCEES